MDGCIGSLTWDDCHDCIHDEGFGCLLPDLQFEQEAFIGKDFVWCSAFKSKSAGEPAIPGQIALEIPKE